VRLVAGVAGPHTTVARSTGQDSWCRSAGVTFSYRRSSGAHDGGGLEPEREAYAGTAVVSVRTAVISVRTAIIGIRPVVTVIGPIVAVRSIVAVSIGIDMASPVAVPCLLNQTNVQFSVVDGSGYGCSRSGVWHRKG